MSMINTIQERLRIPALLLVAFSLIALAGCGKEAPGKSTITVTAFGIPEIVDPVSVPSVTAPTTKTQTYIVSVADSAGNPLNDIDVNFMGQFTNGQAIKFGGATGSVIGSMPLTLSTSQKTDNYGFMKFKVTAPYYAIGVQLLPPYDQKVLAGSGAGSLTDDTYSYTVTSVDFAGESTSLGLSSIILSGVTNTITLMGTGSVDLSWKRVTGASRYYVYAQTSTSGLGLLFFLDCDPNLGCSDPVTYTDNGSWWLSLDTSITPPSVNTTGLGLNGVKGTAQATSGTALSTFTINF